MRKSSLALIATLYSISLSNVSAMNRDMPSAATDTGFQERSRTCPNFLAAFCCRGILPWLSNCCETPQSSGYDTQKSKSSFAKKTIGCCRKRSRKED